MPVPEKVLGVELVIMKPRITLLTLGVDDLERSVAFYRNGLGLPTKGIVGTEYEHGAVAFFDLQSGLKLALWKRDDLAWDAGIPKTAGSPTELSIGHNVNSKDEVDSVMDQARTAGATIVKASHETFWGGYAGYFQDPDGHLWEIAWNPQLQVE
jgi:catechol 2,3-dioxygenase-like lactoylglutathione lyase family enzyme